jgi:hypothetical protein
VATERPETKTSREPARIEAHNAQVLVELHESSRSAISINRHDCALIVLTTGIRPTLQVAEENSQRRVLCTSRGRHERDEDRYNLVGNVMIDTLVRLLPVAKQWLAGDVASRFVPAREHRTAIACRKLRKLGWLAHRAAP